MILLLWSTWARLSEFLWRVYPDDVRANHNNGIIVIVPRSKTNCGARIERFAISHETNEMLCPVCALRLWLDWLGPNYRGPLFPFLSRETRLPYGLPLNRQGFNRQLQTALKRANVPLHLTSYSFRRGGATKAVADGWDFGRIAAKLRHATLASTIDYIDVSALFELMGNTVE
jgi:hypothetical protein